MKTLLQKLHPVVWMVSVFALAFSACSEDLGLNQPSQISVDWLENVDPEHNWITAIPVQLDVNTNRPGKVTVRTINKSNVTILAQKEIASSSVMFVDIPQTAQTSFGVEFDDGSGTPEYARIDITGKKGEVLTVDFLSGANTNRAPMTRANTDYDPSGGDTPQKETTVPEIPSLFNSQYTNQPKNLQTEGEKLVWDGTPAWQATYPTYQATKWQDLNQNSSWVRPEFAHYSADTEKEKRVGVDFGYRNFGPWAWKDVAEALPENKSMYSNYKPLRDYEFMVRNQLTGLGEQISNEQIFLSCLYGYTGNNGDRVLGYYEHSINADGTNDYSDIQFIDIADLTLYDYFNGHAKVQYQLNSDGKWRDANFDYLDKPANINGANNTKRRGDQCFCTLNVHEYYGDQVSAIRGLTFYMGVQKGKAIGLYLRGIDTPISDEQKNNMIAAGVPADKVPTYAANYSNVKFNTSAYNGIRSGLAVYDNFTFIGFEDNMTGGDMDCNDVVLAVTNKNGGKFMPEVTKSTIESDINDPVFNPSNPNYSKPDYDYEKPPLNPGNPEEKEDSTDPYDGLQSYTVAFENQGTHADFDFNDAVILITPNTATNKCEIYLLAAGALSKTKIFYDDDELFEVHEAFGVESSTMVNTYNVSKDPVFIGEINWPEATLEDNLKRFTLKAYDEDGNLTTEFAFGDYLSANGIKNIPQAICVEGLWNWPKESQRIENAYNNIGQWATNHDNKDFWDWYNYPQSKEINEAKKPDRKEKGDPKYTAK